MVKVKRFFENITKRNVLSKGIDMKSLSTSKTNVTIDKVFKKLVPEINFCQKEYTM
jgi:hypothetical protein